MFETVTDKQHEAVKWEITELASAFKVPVTKAYRYPDIARKKSRWARQNGTKAPVNIINDIDPAFIYPDSWVSYPSGILESGHAVEDAKEDPNNDRMATSAKYRR